MYHSVWLQEMWNSCTSVFPNTRAWEQQERNKTKRHEDGKKSQLVSQLDLILIDEATADRLFRLAKKEGTIQYGYRTWGTHALVFSQTFEHGNSISMVTARTK